MAIGQEVVAEQRGVDQGLDDAAHEASVAKVDLERMISLDYGKTLEFPKHGNNGNFQLN